MTRSRESKSRDEDDPELRRSQTVFKRTLSFDKAVDGLQRAKILPRIDYFEKAWKSSRSIADIPRGFDYKSIYLEKGKYRVGQFDAGRDHRVSVVFLQVGQQAYYVHAFRKTRQRNREHMETAKNLAKSLWVLIVEEGAE